MPEFWEKLYDLQKILKNVTTFWNFWKNFDKIVGNFKEMETFKEI